jgi:hypothetical protein
MNRVLHRFTPWRRRCAALLLAAPLLAQGQVSRVFPADSLQGHARFASAPQMSVNCIPYALGPGVHVYDEHHRLLLTGQLAGLHGHVVFERDASGNVTRVWFMNPLDAALTPVPNAPSTCLFAD